MQKINPLLDQASKELKKDSSASLTEVGQSSSASAVSEGVAEPTGEFKEDARIDRVDAINQIFAEFEFAYHNQFHKAFSDVESQIIAKKYWLSSLEQYSPVQILQAAKQVIRTQDYLPSIAALVKACEQGLDLFGLPASRQAYIEACAASSPKRDHPWSHEAVYLAGQAAGWFLLASEPEAVAFPLFDYHYQLLCRRVINGEKLELAAAAPLPDKISRALSKSEAKSRLSKMREELGL
jgi:Replication protein P